VSTYPPGTGTVAGDAAIAQQIEFTTYPDGASQTGQTGVMRLWATNNNLGKASVRFYEPWTGTPDPIIPGSALATITATYRWYMQLANTSRTPAFNMLVLGANNVLYSLSWVPGEGDPDAWNTFSLNANTGGLRIYCNSGCPGSSATFTMASLLANATYGSQLSGGQVFGVGFNLGSDQKECYVGFDWLETSLLNGGARIDFGPVGPPPEPRYPLVTMGGAVIGGAAGQNIAPSNGWMWGVGLPGVPAKVRHLLSFCACLHILMFAAVFAQS
jgi:hypothetical protein